MVSVDERGSRRLGLIGAAVVVGVILLIALCSIGAAPLAHASGSPSSSVVRHPAKPNVAPEVSPSTVPSATASSATSVTSAPVVAPPAPATPAPSTVPTVAVLVAQVEAAGIVPGSTWSWSMADAAGRCGITAAPGVAVGCTSWSSGTVQTLFTGSPSLALVAHEVANAETEQYAIPSLLNEVSAAAGGSSWSPTDAVASCLVVHFLGFQDDAAGSWQCPSTLASSVALHIHDTVVTTRTTAVCGTTSGSSSTLTFTADLGALTVTSPSGGSVAQTASAGVPLTVSGVGTFTAIDVGGTVSVAGVCTG